MSKHINTGACEQIENILNLPEWMTREQQKSMDDFKFPSERGLDPQKKWSLLYKALFPDCPWEPVAGQYTCHLHLCCPTR